jgi:DNA replication and repair protein RecF
MEPRPSRASRDRHRERCLGPGLIVRTVSLRNIRSYARLDLDLEPGLVLAVGPNGAGKTNLLEALHLGTQGFSPRTRSDAQVLRFGEDAGRVALRGDRAGAAVEVEVGLRAGQAKRARLNGASLAAAEQLRSRLTTLVFTPDRLAVVKGGPAVRRAYLDRALGRLVPARAALPAEYGAAVGQRNAALRRVALGVSTHEALAPWTERVAALGAELAGARSEAVRLLSPTFAARAEELGLAAARLDYAPDPPTVAAFDARLARELERGSTGIGPHLDEIGVLAGDRDLRSFGSQGEQRLAVLALLRGEADVLASRSGVPPLLLFDDVLSELDADRRAALARGLPADGQTLITATSRELLPIDPAQVVVVSPGEARAA